MEPKPARVMVVGSANVDLVARTERLPGPGETVLGTEFFEAPGGKGLNQAVAAARSGAPVSLLAMIGPDAAGDLVRRVLAEDGIDDACLELGTAPTGRALIGVSSSGENSIIVVPGANAALALRHVTTHGVSIGAASVVLAQLEVPVDVVAAAFQAARHSGATTVLNPAPAQPLARELLQLVDICIPNEHEVELLGGVGALRSAGVSAVVVTLGAEGALLVDDDGEHRIPAFAVTPVDTTGAGDTFCGSFAARLALGDDLRSALRWASAAAALSTTRPGAVPSVPHVAEIEALLAAQG